MKRIKKLICVSAAVVLIVTSGCLTSYFIGQKNGRRIAVDFSLEELEKDNREPKYKFIPAALSNYICDLSAELELDPFNWKHNTYIALHHMKYLDEKFKVQDDVIMAYNCGEGAVMNGTIPQSTYIYLAKVKNNYMLLKSCKRESEKNG